MKITGVILAVLLFAGCSSINVNQKTAVSDSVIQSIDRYINKIGEEGNFSGAVLVAKDGNVLINKAFGYAHLGFKVPNKVDTKFNYASIGKSFTSVAIFQLIENGKLSLSDKVGKYLTEYPNKIIRDSVTIEQLLTHTSGVPNYFGSAVLLNSSKDLYRTINDLSPLYENEPMEFHPGEAFSYRNTNYILLGRIIEKITGKLYDDYIRDNIFLPASMPNTGNFDNDHPVKNAAEGYTLSEIYHGQYKINIHTAPVRGSAAGGGYTTLMDLYNFTLAFRRNQLLNKTNTDLLKEPLNKTSSYGYGMQFANPEAGTIYGHSGGHFGASGEWRVYEKEGYTVILLTNKDADQGFLDARFYIQKLISGSTPTIDQYFFTKTVVDKYLKDGFINAIELIKTNPEKLSERDLNAKGYEFLKKGEFKKAIDVFKLEVHFFEDSYNAYDSLAEAYMESENKELAILNYEKSLELNPENKNAEQMLERLKGK